MLRRTIGTERLDRARTPGRGRHSVVAAAVVALAGAGVPASADAQSGDAEAVMVAAGEWVLQQVPGGQPHLDPHRSGEGQDAARLQRVARALGAGLTTLDQSRQCDDAMNRATCRLTVERLLTIAEPRVDGDRAQVKVYAWFRSSSPTDPVGQRRWDLSLERDARGWRVTSG